MQTRTHEGTKRAQGGNLEWSTRGAGEQRDTRGNLERDGGHQEAQKRKGADADHDNQPDNMVHMKAKGAAVVVELNSLTSEDLRDAINTVIDGTTYKESAMRLSRIHHDRPMSPLDEAVFWIEFTMRHKGAKHLRVQAHELTWYQYHSLHVLSFLLSVVLLLLFLLDKTCRFCFRRSCCRRNTKRKAE
nr:UDP-glucuronosyltransferase 2A1-like [Nothobranchius furzeri]